MSGSKFIPNEGDPKTVLSDATSKSKEKDLLSNTLDATAESNVDGYNDRLRLFFERFGASQLFKIAEFLENPLVSLHSIPTDYPWTQIFLPPDKSAADLQNAKREFDVDPIFTIDVLERFWDSLISQEIAVYMCKSSDHSAIFLNLCKSIMKRFREAERGTSANTPPPKPVVSSITPETEIAALLAEHRLMYHNLDLGEASLNIEKDVVEAVVAEALCGRNYKDYLDIMPDLERLVKTPFYGESILLSSPDESVGSPILWGFERNVRTFTHSLTGQPVRMNESLHTCFEQLGKTGAAISQQFNPVYAEISKLRSIVEKQNQIISSLEYRRLLENLPNKARYDTVLRLQPHEKTATRYWAATWKDLVEAETRSMFQAARASTSAPIAPATITAKRPLTQLFQSDFDYWLSKNPRSTGPGVPHGVFERWPAYTRGEKLYGELSSNVHQYGSDLADPYDIKATNWSRSDRLILAALRPDKAQIFADADGIWDVKWVSERVRHGLK